MNDINKKLSAIEERLTVIENRLSQQTADTAQTTNVIDLESLGQEASQSNSQSADKPSDHHSKYQEYRNSSLAKEHLPKSTGRKPDITATQVLGLSGAAALVLAMSYLVKLTIDTGWFTPMRQISLAFLMGASLVSGGIYFKNINTKYTSLLPASGLVILYLSIYGAHNYYSLISPSLAFAAIMIISGGALYLCNVFKNLAFTFFSVIGTYSAPFLIATRVDSLIDQIIYFSVWSIIYCIFSIRVRNRAVYLIALYLGLVGFNILSTVSYHNWLGTIIFQSLQFAIFVMTTIYFSIRYKQPLVKSEEFPHLAALILFYFLQYSTLNRYMPVEAPYISIFTSGLLLCAYLITKQFLKKDLNIGGNILIAYITLTLFHAGFLELIPDNLAPWFILVMAPALLFSNIFKREQFTIGKIIIFFIALFYFLNFCRAIFQIDTHLVPLSGVLSFLYPLQLYIGYYLTNKEKTLQSWREPLIYFAHIGLMSALAHLLDTRILISLSWGILALACLLISIYKKEQFLGKSSLLIFIISGLKVVCYDLAEAAPLVRIGCLIILSITFYIGGWLYQKSSNQ